MRSLVPLLLACLALAPLAATAQETLPRATDASDCPVPPEAEPEWWSAPERYAWRQVCAGEIADMRFATEADGTRGADDGAGCRAFTPDPDDPTQLLEPDAWPATRDLSPRFLRQIAARAPFTEAPAMRAVRIYCADVTGPLSFRDEDVPQTLWLLNSRLDAGLDLRDARVGGDLAFNGSLLPDLLDATGTQIVGDWFLQDVHARRIRALVAKIGGDVSATGATFTGLFTADRMEVGGSLFLQDMPSVAEVDLPGAKIGGVVSAERSTFTGPFDADRMEVGGDLFLRDMGGAQDMLLAGIRVRQDLQLHGSTITGAVNLTGAQIGGALELWQGGDEVAWQEGAALVLRNASAGALQARMPESWRVAGSGEAIRYDLQGFSYDRLGGNSSGADHDLARANDAEALVDWLQAERPPGMAAVTAYGPQPYRQLAEVLRAQGAEAQADRVDFARLMHRRATRFGDAVTTWDTMVAAFRWAVDTAALVFVGFGVYPGVALGWFAALVATGWAVARRSPDLAGQGTGKAFFYSLENALPLIDLTGDFADIRHAGAPRIAGFFHFQKVAGFVLATVLVGALTLLGG